ncbi:hypothetical protein NKR23_g1340 [Pleurostoma richardsiae]|uniref:Uncharacterized protein n=1 Tax=Pleurostoma richardsiae TaxID=41990 RepID=A0AA38VK78_9PEZI|nr:hypothetical protein NKR23_g1340 [Pleurostoma richardsiae]
MEAPVTSPTMQHASMSASSFQTSPSSKIIPPPPASVKTPSTDPFLKDFTLVAEAAKRAQMAVMMRDFESVGLS